MNQGKKNIIPIEAGYFRDELNFAEFPLSSLDSKTKKQSLIFEDNIRDKGSNALVTRKLTVSASAEYGLPTPVDDEVLLGLIQLTSKENFQTKTVNFTRYELIKKLGWKDHSESYKRLEQALNKWVGVTLYYDNAWWNKEEQSWVSEKFHVLDSVTLLGKERREKRVKKEGSLKAGESSFTWNEHVFRSFQAGHLKKLDFQFYSSLKHNIGKRIYRFLDKRFYQRSSYSFDFRVFACEHIGLNREYSNSKLKERLKPGIDELVEKGFLAEMPDERRFLKQSRGQWKIFLSKAQVAETSAPKEAEVVAFKQEKKSPDWIVRLLSEMDKEERENLLREALKQASPPTRKIFESSKERKGALYQEMCIRIIRDYLEQENVSVEAVG